MQLVDPHVDVVVLTRDDKPLRRDVAEALGAQRGVLTHVHRVVGAAWPQDTCRWDTICRARNEGKRFGGSPWLMFLDDDVVLEPGCIAALLSELVCRPNWAAIAADYLGERTTRGPAGHVAMGATLFRRDALSGIRFSWRGDKCECQCCCDDLRSRRLAIEYSPTARARHVPDRRGLVRSDAATAPYRQRVAPTTEHSRQPKRSHQPTVCVVICYWGKLPGWMDYFLLSCAYNPTIDFLIITDQIGRPEAPPNVRFEKMDRERLVALATEKSGLPCRIDRPYKLVDFKPLFGHILEDLIGDVDYWGYSDLDVVFGDVRHALNRLRLWEYDVLTARREFLVGHFTLLRNSPELRTLYRESRDLSSTLWRPKAMSFDECGWQWMRRFRGQPLTDQAACDSMSHIVGRLSVQGRIRACLSTEVLEWPEVMGNRWRLEWDSGRLRQASNGKEAMYFHFHAFKHGRGFQRPKSLSDSLSFAIEETGFHPRSRDSSPSVDALRLVAPS